MNECGDGGQDGGNVPMSRLDMDAQWINEAAQRAMAWALNPPEGDTAVNEARTTMQTSSVSSTLNILFHTLYLHPENLPRLVACASLLNPMTAIAVMSLIASEWMLLSQKSRATFRGLVNSRPSRLSAIASYTVLEHMITMKHPQLVASVTVPMKTFRNVLVYAPKHTRLKTSVMAAEVLAWFQQKAEELTSQGKATAPLASDMTVAQELGKPMSEIKTACEMLCEHGKLRRNREHFRRPVYEMLLSKSAGEQSTTVITPKNSDQAMPELQMIVAMLDLALKEQAKDKLKESNDGPALGMAG